MVGTKLARKSLFAYHTHATPSGHGCAGDVSHRGARNHAYGEGLADIEHSRVHGSHPTNHEAHIVDL
jgi:hypothetical protein